MSAAPIQPAPAPSAADAKPRRARKRRGQVAVISDLPPGTYSCHAQELLRYLKSIRPAALVLNGDILDIWQFCTTYLAARPHAGAALPGRPGRQGHPNPLPHRQPRRAAAQVRGPQIGAFSARRQAGARPAARPHLVVSRRRVRRDHAARALAGWLAKLGGHGYDLLIVLNRLVNFGLAKLGRPRVAFSKLVKEKVKTAVAAINTFETTAVTIAADRGYRYVACGHIHQPKIKETATEKGPVTYLNSGDWLENLTALEYPAPAGWQLYHYHADPRMAHAAELPDATAPAAANPATLLQRLLAELTAA